MDAIFLDNLPRQKGFGANKDKVLIDWKKSVNYNIIFKYNGKNGNFHIVGYIPKEQKLILEYDSKQYITKTKNIINCNLNTILNPKKVFKFRYNINNVIKTEKSDIKILEQMKIKQNNGIKIKSYKYKCLNCGNIDIITESNILLNNGCNVCCKPPKKILKGVNDIATTHPYLIKYFANKEDIFNHTYASNKKVLMICPDCGYKKKMQISNLYNQGFNCNKCGDGVSYPEKILFNILNQISIKFNCQNMFEWNANRIYDFYIPSLNCIIETHGEQHYRYTGRGRSLELEQENDKLKEQLAKENGIEHYIVINCRKSELEFIKQNILNSKLNELFDLSNIDWNQCEEFACSSLVKKACDLWNEGTENILKISNILKLDRHTIRRYLIKGNKLNWCDYNDNIAEENRLKNCRKKRIKKVKCITLNKIYDSLIEAEKELGVSYTSISACCNNKRKSAGELKNKTKLFWEYVEE
ncbi:hypothetical protein CF087_21130 [Clostridium botulinum]|uniref:hypothetical protein n=2 Tax=Clostridium botulinum TaxID=1491 RepID=UPI0007749C05|nr:hypothetical protein [Clostridium botulinum]MBN3352022.1 hypothetical protein [Clostridium botulinum]MBN3376342.1 hypothetical protein [Clostridium botulinum]QDY27008.1 hypothetical protein CGQ40_20095 [Clostridium botulinum]